MADARSLVQWSAEAACQLGGPDQPLWLARIEGRLAEITEALDDCAKQQLNELGLRLAANLGRFWWMSGRASQGQRRLADFLQLDLTTPSDSPFGSSLPPYAPELLADALLALGGTAYAQAQFALARQALQQAAARYETLGRITAHASATNQLGMIARETADLDAAWALHQQALQLFRTQGDEPGVVACLSNLGVVAMYAGDLDEADRLHRLALDERRRLGDIRGVASSLGSLANIARWRGDLGAAEKGHQEVLAMRQQLNDPWGVAGSQLNLAVVACLRGDHELSTELLRLAQQGFSQVQDRLGLCEVRDATAELLAAQGKSAEAVSCFAAACRARDGIGAPLSPLFERKAQATLAELRAVLSADDFARAWQAGLAADPDDFSFHERAP